MIKKLIISAVLATGLLRCYAQDTLNAHGYGWVPREHMFNQYIGVQGNQLIRQIINLNSSTPSPINDPYLVTYSINLAKSGWGLQAGIGFNYQQITDKTSPANQVSKINDLSYRIGIGRRRMISKRFEAGYGIDFVAAKQSDKTTSSTVTNLGQIGTQDSTATQVTSKVTSMGFGAEASLNFYINKRVIIGTEATGYFMKAKQKQNIFNTDVTTDNFVVFQSTSSNSNTETDTDGFSFTLPVALFIIVKF